MFNDLSHAWSWHPAVLAVIFCFCALYLWGVWGASRRSRSDAREPSVPFPRIAAFFGAMILLLVLLVSPLNTIGRTQLFLAHAFQVTIMTTVCVPLILAACPAVMLRPLQKTPVVREILRFLVSPLVATLLFNLTFLIWHTPRLYMLAMANANLYVLMMLMLFFTSLLHWFPLMGSLHEWRRMGYLLQAVYAFLDGQPADIFAIVLLTNGVLYPYAIPAQVGLSASLDQMSGAGILLVPGIIDLVVMTPFFIRWLGQLEERTRLADQRRQEELAMLDDEEDDDEYNGVGESA
jgi:cytochrome c oxidase assembly factor CtaG